MLTESRQSIVQVQLANGATLPFVDVTHPAFLVDDRRENLEKWRAAIAAPASTPTSRTGTQAEVKPSFYLPGLIERMFGCSAGYLDGWATYLLKIGAENLPSSASDIERRLLASPNALSLRVRLQQLSHVIADYMAKAPNAPSFRLISLGGGTAIELLNALLICIKQPGARVLPLIEIAVLDIDGEGSGFGSASLEALRQLGGPLAGIEVSLTFYAYSWAEPSTFSGIADQWRRDGACMIVSSEGALFEYASNETVEANLRFWWEAGAKAVVGSAIRADAAGGAMVQRSPFPLYARSTERVDLLAKATGYRLTSAVEGVATDQFILERTGSARSPFPA
ncbi:hypothetical protein [Devosia sp.]